MTRGWVAAAALVVAVIVGGCGSESDPVVTPAERAVTIRADGCRVSLTDLGSGTAIGGDRVLTVAHAVAGSEIIEVTTRSGDALVAEISAIDTDLDLAVLTVAGLDLPEVDMASFDADVSGTMFGAGTDAFLDFEVRRRVDINFADIYNDGEYERDGYELVVQVMPGDSGAGLFDADGVLGGLVFASSRSRDDRTWATDIIVAEGVIGAAGDIAPAVPCVANNR